MVHLDRVRDGSSGSQIDQVGKEKQLWREIHSGKFVFCGNDEGCGIRYFGL